MRKTIIAPGEHYHIFNRGNNKQLIFLSDADRIRFLVSILLFQSPAIIKNIGRISKSVAKNVQNLILHNKELVNDIASTRFVELNCFTLMPNHFHLLVQEKKEGGVAKYMQRLQIAYTRYFNIKNDNVGHHFQGHYKAVHIENNNQLLYLSTYIHRNPRELSIWKGKENLYPWSSFQDYISNNRWDELLKPNIVLEQFNKLEEYKRFVNSSSAKTLRNLDAKLFFD
ncbi:MAG: transposase [Candidatus Sungbacteria bacterium]|uniref:Transposase n=1 Tax=Candidatus Sungiibacteriota bacterium TaxID=2750080 RepID=A0A932DRZ5_9BACT|nr:transposase [Candidatus Sungbacteria bacterium]